ncbi:hypothetical protein GOV13_02365 [Candidatus Pacearchaeota archaeon]|nr:hypothetical protein [Candidatus Pacearchaeota archaeon]
MDLLRTSLDYSYDLVKRPLFRITKNDAETTHNLLVLFSKILNRTGLEKVMLDNESNYLDNSINISNAAGLNKNGKISPMFWNYLGFDRSVIGTVTGEFWPGNKRPRIKRHLPNESLINWVGWANDGAKIIAKRVDSYKDYDLPITINLGATPDPNLTLREKISDLEKTVKLFRKIFSVDRFEYNPSCQNIGVSMEENLKLLEVAVKIIKENALSHQELYVKVSPDMNEREISKTIKATYDSVEGYVTTNTTTRHKHPQGSGSGEILYPPSLRTQKEFYNKLKDTSKRIIACGGINSIKRIIERRTYGAEEFQILTPLIYSGPKLLRNLRMGLP